MAKSTVTKDELEFRTNLASRLTAIEATQQHLISKLDDKMETLRVELKPLVELHTVVQEHDRDISRWKGVNAVFTAILTAVAGWFAHAKHWF